MGSVGSVVSSAKDLSSNFAVGKMASDIKLNDVIRRKEEAEAVSAKAQAEYDKKIKSEELSKAGTTLRWIGRYLDKALQLSPMVAAAKFAMSGVGSWSGASSAKRYHLDSKKKYVVDYFSD